MFAGDEQQRVSRFLQWEIVAPAIISHHPQAAQKINESRAELCVLQTNINLTEERKSDNSGYEHREIADVENRGPPIFGHLRRGEPERQPV